MSYKDSLRYQLEIANASSHNSTWETVHYKLKEIKFQAKYMADVPLIYFCNFDTEERIKLKAPNSYKKNQNKITIKHSDSFQDEYKTILEWVLKGDDVCIVLDYDAHGEVDNELTLNRLGRAEYLETYVVHDIQRPEVVSSETLSVAEFEFNIEVG